jgi:hypothetical protein
MGFFLAIFCFSDRTLYFFCPAWPWTEILLSQPPKPPGPPHLKQRVLGFTRELSERERVAVWRGHGSGCRQSFRDVHPLSQDNCCLTRFPRIAELPPHLVKLTPWWVSEGAAFSWPPWGF